MDKIIITIKKEDIPKRNELHFQTQLMTRSHQFKSKKVYSRKQKHKKSYCF